MPDDFNTLSDRLLNRCPAVGTVLARQLINDSWRTLQARREWSWRRRSGCFAPPAIYTTGSASSNVAAGNSNIITGTGTTWTQAMIGSQIRVGGLLNPYYTIIGWISATSILIDQPWYGPDVTNQPYQILQIYYSVPDDFNYWYYVVSIKDGYRLWTNITEDDLALLDPQRTNTGQTYAVAFRDYNPQYGGTVGAVLPVGATGPAPISTTNYGYTFPANATYIIQVVTGGVTGTATYQWMRSGQTAFSLPVLTADFAVDLSDGVQIYWPDGLTYNSGDLFIINCQSLVTASGPRYELWPGPTFPGYLYPYIYIAKESDLTADRPALPPFIASRGEVLLEMALAAAARFPGSDAERPNPYYSLALAGMHETRVTNMLIDLERNDEEVGVTNVTYQTYPLYPAPFLDGSWQQSHAPFLRG